MTITVSCKFQRTECYLIHCCCLVAKSYPTLMTPWTVAHQTPLSMGLSQQEYWSRLLFFFLQRILLTQGSNLCLLHWLADSLPLSHQGSPHLIHYFISTLSRYNLHRKKIQFGEVWQMHTIYKQQHNTEFFSSLPEFPLCPSVFNQEENKHSSKPNYLTPDNHWSVVTIG